MLGHELSEQVSFKSAARRRRDRDEVADADEIDGAVFMRTLTAIAEWLLVELGGGENLRRMSGRTARIHWSETPEQYIFNFVEYATITSSFL